MTKRSRSQAKLPCVSKVKPYLRVQFTAIFHNLVHNASSMPSLLLCQWKASKVNWEDSKICELKISAGVPSGELKAAMLWRQTIVLRISKSGNALDCWPFLSQIGTKSTNAIKYSPGITAVSTVNILKPRQSCSWIYKISKRLVSPNKRFNNIIDRKSVV